MYNYKIKPIKIIDGDTIDAEIDLGFDISVKKFTFLLERSLKYPSR